MNEDDLFLGLQHNDWIPFTRLIVRMDMEWITGEDQG